jgi:hypothetical protein
MISPMDFAAIVFATGAVIEVWHKGSIFDTPRAYAQALQDITAHDSLKGRLLELLNCPFCKSYHVPVYLLIGLLAGDWIGGTIAAVVRIVVYGLAATRVSNVIDGLLPDHLRYIPNPFGDTHGRRADGTRDDSRQH